MGGLALPRRDVFRTKQPSGYVDAPGPSNAHAAFGARGDGVAARRDVDLEELRTSVNKPDSPPPTRCHATDTTENCGGDVLHVISGIPLAAIIAWSGGTRRAISGQMPLVCLGGQICKRTLDLEKNVESDGFAELNVTISRQKAGD